MRSAFHNLKNNAKRRNKEFSLTFEQFKEFCIATEYHSKRGVHRYSYTVDRIVETEGYHLDNIQVLTNRDNVKKYLTYVYSERQGNMIIVEKKSQIDPDAEDLPF